MVDEPRGGRWKGRGNGMSVWRVIGEELVNGEIRKGFGNGGEKNKKSCWLEKYN